MSETRKEYVPKNQAKEKKEGDHHEKPEERKHEKRDGDHKDRPQKPRSDKPRDDKEHHGKDDDRKHEKRDRDDKDRDHHHKKDRHHEERKHGEGQKYRPRNQYKEKLNVTLETVIPEMPKDRLTQPDEKELDTKLDKIEDEIDALYKKMNDVAREAHNKDMP